jgi:hypothetical protein
MSSDTNACLLAKNKVVLVLPWNLNHPRNVVIWWERGFNKLLDALLQQLTNPCEEP